METLSLSPINTFIFKEPNVAQTLVLLDRCSTMEELKQIHARMCKTGLILDAIPASKLLTLCTSPDFGNLAYAETVFKGIARPNNFMWNTMIRGYSSKDYPEKALVLYHQMLCLSVPHNAYTFPFILKACSSLNALQETQQIHARIIKTGFSAEIHATNALLHAYAKFSNIESARLLFDRIPELDVVSWNSMIDGYAKCGDMEMALKCFNNMPVKNLISWTTLISGYIEAGQTKEALNLFHDMQIAEIEADNVLLASILSACADLGAIDEGRWIHAYITKNEIRIDSVLSCVLVDMYAKCGDVDEAQKVFNEMGRKQNVASWTAMIAGFAIHGRGREALDWFLKMQEAGVNPNLITFTAVLTACSYAGLVHEGKSLFKSIDRVYGLKPSIEHYGCMVDLLGRVGLLKEAREIVENMPMKPNSAILGALLKACKIHGNTELGKQIGKMLIQVDPGQGSRHVQLASIYALAGEWDQVGEVRKQMKDQGIPKLPGCSAISLNGLVHEFSAGVETHEI